jgi:Ca2+-binding RTX toxin-like protein
VITTAAATGTIRNDDLIGDATANTLVGTARAEFLDGRANRDTLTGGGAADVFGFRFGESRLSAPDVITDFGTDDKIDLFSASGAALPAPRGFSLVADNGSATTLGGLAAAVFADANFVPGNQALGANSAVFVRSTNAAIAGTYLVINNATPGLSERDDLMIKLTGVFPGRPGPTSLFFQI